MPFKSAEPVQIHRVVSRDREAAGEMLKTVYGPGVTADFSTSSPFAMNFTVAPIGSVVLVKADVAGMDCTRALDGRVQIYMPVRGKLFQRAAGNEGWVADAKRGAIVRPGLNVRQSVEKGEALVLTLSVEQIAERAELLTGKALPADFLNGAPEPLDLSGVLGSALMRNARLAYAELLELEKLGYASLVARSYEDILMNISTVLLVPDVAQAMVQPEKQQPLAAIKKARDYIEAHATDVIEISRLAADLGLGMRTLQVNFLREYGFSPRDYIMECRLEHARHRLTKGEAATSVTEIALSSGFPNLSHFAAKYRDKYGELPSETVRKSRA